MQGNSVIDESGHTQDSILNNRFVQRHKQSRNNGVSSHGDEPSMMNAEYRKARARNLLDLYQYYRYLNTNTHRDVYDNYLEVRDKEAHTSEKKHIFQQRALLLKSRQERDAKNVAEKNRIEHADEPYSDLLYYGDDAQGMIRRNQHPLLSGPGEGSPMGHSTEALRGQSVNFDDGLNTDLQRAALKEAYVNQQEQEQAFDSRYASPSAIASAFLHRSSSSHHQGNKAGTDTLKVKKNAVLTARSTVTKLWDYVSHEDDVSLSNNKAGAYGANGVFRPTRDLFVHHYPTMMTAAERQQNYFNPEHLVQNLKEYQHQQENMTSTIELLPPNQRTIHAVSRYARNPLTGERLPYTELEDNIYSREWNQAFQLFPSRTEEQLNEKAARRVLGLPTTSSSPKDPLHARDAAQIYQHRIYGHPHYANDGTRLPNVFWELPFNYDIDYKHWPIEQYIGRVYTAHIAWRRNPWSDVLIMLIVGALSVSLAKLLARRSNARYKRHQLSSQAEVDDPNFQVRCKKPTKWQRNVLPLLPERYR